MTLWNIALLRNDIKNHLHHQVNGIHGPSKKADCLPQCLPRLRGQTMTGVRKDILHFAPAIFEFFHGLADAVSHILVIPLKTTGYGEKQNDCLVDHTDKGRSGRCLHSQPLTLRHLPSDLTYGVRCNDRLSAHFGELLPTPLIFVIDFDMRQEPSIPPV